MHRIQTFHFLYHVQRSVILGRRRRICLGPRGPVLFFAAVGRGAQGAGDGSWERWQPIRLAGVNITELDLYFFAVQDNPSDKATLLALMPVSEPPWACIAAAYSRDGVTFSTPINIHLSRVGFRKHVAKTARDKFKQSFSARAEDHPVANVVPDPTDEDGNHYLLYIHH